MKKLSLLFLFLIGLVAPCLAQVPFTNAALSSTAVLVSARTSPSTPNLVLYNISNPNSSTVYVQFFDSATAGTVTVGTTAPFFWFAIPANSGVTDNGLPFAIPFANGIVVAATTTPTGNTAPSTAIPTVLFYK